MALVRLFALNLLRSAQDKQSLKTRRKVASWNPDCLAFLLSGSARDPNSLAWRFSSLCRWPHGPRQNSATYGLRRSVLSSTEPETRVHHPAARP